MRLRRVETALAWFTLAALVVHVPAETSVSLPYGLLNAFDLVDAIALALMFSGAVRSLRARPGSAPGVLCAAYGWAGGQRLARAVRPRC